MGVLSYLKIRGSLKTSGCGHQSRMHGHKWSQSKTCDNFVLRCPARAVCRVDGISIAASASR